MSTHFPPSADAHSGRALILCCDGTGNIWGNGHDTNVVKLARLIEANERQLLYYDPGVGTTDNFPPIGMWNKSKAYVNRLVGLALASGIYEDIGKGYEFLIDNYRAGDRIYLFGFSRGAFTARSIAGMVNLFGIIRSGGKPMIPTLVRTYFFPAQQQDKGRSDKTRSDIAADIRQHFCDAHGRDAWVFFTGVWDTVATVGGIRGLRITSDKSLKEKRFTHVRHAVALDEYRNKYEPRLYKSDPRDFPDSTRSFKQLWFSGCHSDVGGSYRESELSDITLRWMIDEVQHIQPALRMKESAAIHGDYRGLAHDEPFGMPFWSVTGLQRRSAPDAADKHPTALQREQSRGEPKSVWRPLLTRPWFWASLAAAEAVHVVGNYRVLKQSELETSLAAMAGVSRYQAWPSHYCDAPAAFTQAAGIAGTWWDFLMIPAYACLFAVLLVHAHRRLNFDTALRLPPVLDRLAAQWPLLILMLADVGENLSALQLLDSGCATLSPWSYVVPLLSAIKFAALACLCGYLLLGLLRPSKKKTPISTSTPDGIVREPT